MASDVGQPAPDFTLVDSTGENVTLSQYRDNKNVVLSFHVFDFTGG
jgi:peroxiredoxin